MWQWPGTDGAFGTHALSIPFPKGGGRGSRPISSSSPWADKDMYNMDALKAIMGKIEFPTWETTPDGGRWDKEWTMETCNLSDMCVELGRKELKESATQHEAWKAQKKIDSQEQKRYTGYSQSYERHEQGYWNRMAIWERLCKIGAVASLVIKIDGMKLECKADGWVDRNSAQAQIKHALTLAAGPNDDLKKSILDVVCSKSDSENGTTAGVRKVSCI